MPLKRRQPLNLPSQLGRSRAVFCLAVPLVAPAAGVAWVCLANRCEANGLFTSIDGTNGPFASTRTF